jgi:hypothetical protein
MAQPVINLFKSIDIDKQTATNLDVLVSGDRYLTGLNRPGLAVKAPGEFLNDVMEP